MKTNKGFTLIEMVVVIAILAALALIIIPQLSGFAKAATTTQAAHASASVGEAVQLYHTTQGFYPDIVEGIKPNATLSAKLSGLTTGQFTAPEIALLSAAGLTKISDVDAIGVPAAVPSTIAVGDVVTLLNPTPLVGDAVGEAVRLGMVKSIYPNGTIPANVKIFVCGVGS